MIPLDPLTYTLAVSAATLVAGACLIALVRRLRRKTPQEIERQRRLEVNLRGRIINGQITDIRDPVPFEREARMVFYKYEVGGVTYESAQDFTTLPGLFARAHRAIGQTASVKYEQRRPTNSIVACEEWCGLPEFKTAQSGKPGPAVAPKEFVKKA